MNSPLLRFWHTFCGEVLYGNNIGFFVPSAVMGEQLVWRKLPTGSLARYSLRFPFVIMQANGTSGPIQGAALCLTTVGEEPSVFHLSLVNQSLYTQYPGSALGLSSQNLHLAAIADDELWLNFCP